MRRLHKVHGEWKFCVVCGKKYWKYPYATKRKYCSIKCRNKGQIPHNKGIYVKSAFKKCSLCGRKFRYYIKYPKKYCSKECEFSSRKGRAKGKQKNFRKKHDKFIRLYLRNLINFNVKIVLLTKTLPDGIIINFKTKEIIGFEAETCSVNAKKKNYIKAEGTDRTIFKKVKLPIGD